LNVIGLYFRRLVADRQPLDDNLSSARLTQLYGQKVVGWAGNPDYLIPITIST